MSLGLAILIRARITQLTWGGTLGVNLRGKRLDARDCDRPFARIQVPAAVLNGFTAVGMPVTESVK